MKSPEIPDGIEIETVYVVEIRYGPDAQEKRAAVRHEHLSRTKRLMDDGRLVEAGGFLDFTAAMLIVRAGSEAQALELVRDDVYLRSGVWVDDAQVRPYGRVVRTT